MNLEPYLLHISKYHDALLDFFPSENITIIPYKVLDREIPPDIYGSASLDSLVYVPKDENLKFALPKTPKCIISGSNEFHHFTYYFLKWYKSNNHSFDVLLTFDAHTDSYYNPEMNNNKLACGNFNRFVIKENLVDEVITYGIPEEKFVKGYGYDSHKEQKIFYTKDDFDNVIDLIKNKRIYLSIDADVCKDINTDYTFSEETKKKMIDSRTLIDLVRIIDKKCEILGMDYCGIPNKVGRGFTYARSSINLAKRFMELCKTSMKAFAPLRSAQ